MKMLLLIFSLLILSNVFAHGDHDEPGAIPPAPHGGVVTEAKHIHDKHKHDHHKASKTEIFFEGIYKGKTIKIYPLILDPKRHKTFISQKVSMFKKTTIVLVDPRKKKEYQVNIIPKENFWEISMETIEGRRFILTINSVYNNANYKGLVQVEKK